MRILGIDPGTATTGYGVIDIKKPKKILKACDFDKDKKIWQKTFTCLKFGTIRTKAGEKKEKRLYKINNEVRDIIKEQKPNLVSVESLYFFRNAKTVISVGQAQGVIFQAIAEADLPLETFTPLQVKKTITGYGRAKKKKVQQDMQKLLCLDEKPTPNDAADALALAMTSFLKSFEEEEDDKKKKKKKKGKKKKK